MNTRVVTAHIPNELADQIDQIAARLDRPKGWIVKQALVSWVELEAKRHQLTLEGLADVDAGRLVDHVSIDAWAKNLDKLAWETAGFPCSLTLDPLNNLFHAICRYVVLYLQIKSGFAYVKH